MMGRNGRLLICILFFFTGVGLVVYNLIKDSQNKLFVFVIYGIAILLFLVSAMMLEMINREMKMEDEIKRYNENVSEALKAIDPLTTDGKEQLALDYLHHLWETKLPNFKILYQEVDPDLDCYMGLFFQEERFHIMVMGDDLIVRRYADEDENTMDMLEEKEYTSEMEKWKEKMIVMEKIRPIYEEEQTIENMNGEKIYAAIIERIMKK